MAPTDVILNCCDLCICKDSLDIAAPFGGKGMAFHPLSTNCVFATNWLAAAASLFGPTFGDWRIWCFADFPECKAPDTCAATHMPPSLQTSAYRPRRADHGFVCTNSSGHFQTASVHVGTWCSGITSASHAEGPGFKSQCVHFAVSTINPSTHSESQFDLHDMINWLIHPIINYLIRGRAVSFWSLCHT